MSAESPAAKLGSRERRDGWRLPARLVIYNLVLLVASPLVAAWLLWRGLARGRSMGSWRHRLGFVPRLGPGRPRVWLHAVSAGEVAAARPVLAALRSGFPQAQIALSTVTAAGMAMAERTCRAANAFFYLPLDGPACMGRALLRVRPDLLVITEKELWPNLLGLSRLLGVRVLVVNGRVSDRMLRRARWAGPFVRWLYRLPDLLCVQSEEDARRLARLGGDPGRICVAGNTKVDNMAERDWQAEAGLARDLSIGPDEQWLVAGSTHPGEDEAVLAAFDRIRAEAPCARLLLAPRHLQRVPAVSALVAQRGFPVMRRSEPAPRPAEAVVVLDTMGELQAAYGVAAAGFVGGTLVPVGGHNLLEPVAAGRPVLFGRHTENCADMAELVLQAGVGFQVADSGELAERFLRITRDPQLREAVAERGVRLIQRQRGASQRCAAAARGLLGPKEDR